MALRKQHLAPLAIGFFAHSAIAQPVLLQIRPHIGDTLRMHLSQSVEMTGTRIRGGRESASGAMTTSIEVFTRAIAHQWTSGGTLMESVTDSVAMTPASSSSLEDLRRRAMQSKRVWLRVSTDGAMEIVNDDEANSELRHVFGEMPAMLSRGPVTVGEKWTREMQIPLTGDPGNIGSVGPPFASIPSAKTATLPTSPCTARCPASMFPARRRRWRAMPPQVCWRGRFRSIAD
jgi:hypothetical protein